MSDPWMVQLAHCHSPLNPPTDFLCEHFHRIVVEEFVNITVSSTGKKAKRTAPTEGRLSRWRQCREHLRSPAGNEILSLWPTPCNEVGLIVNLYRRWLFCDREFLWQHTYLRKLEENSKIASDVLKLVFRIHANDRHSSSVGLQDEISWVCLDSSDPSQQQ